MSLAIRTDRIRSVFVAGEWHDVRPLSFDMDEYEYVDDDGTLIFSGGSGFTFTNDYTGDEIAGPTSSIQAVKYVIFEGEE